MRVQTIANTKITVVQHNEERVLTTEQLAQVYECEPINIKQNFKNNKERFAEGKHYYKIEGDELKKLRLENIELQISPKTMSLYLWTRRGAARHCKMLGTDKAWEMFDALEDNYFTPSIPHAEPKPMSQLDILVENDKIKVDGRELHMFLEVETPYKKWFNRMTEYGFEEGRDFWTFLSKTAPTR